LHLILELSGGEFSLHLLGSDRHPPSDATAVSGI
jgi:hypothetical protein